MLAVYYSLMLTVMKLLQSITERRVITQPAGSTHTIRLISVYIPSLASGHDRGEPRVELISCPPPFPPQTQQNFQRRLCRVHLTLRLS